MKATQDLEQMMATGVSPERWIRLPVRGTCPHTGLSRAHFYTLIKEGKIKTANIRKPGNLTGVRLVWLPSVVEYIERHVEPTGTEA
ncbi:MAG: hypothetical protein EOM20_07145 [Spartobacteria bacterium]|nr:hypothetical protein [Spartobacteria bacterium]